MAVTGDDTESGEMSGYQLCPPTSNLPQGVVMAGSPRAPHNPSPLGEEARRKRELRLMKNREAARDCRRKKKEYVKCLENRVAVLETQNKTLIEELRALKGNYRHKPEEAAKECRRRKREYICLLESRLTMLKVANKKLMENLQYYQKVFGAKPKEEV